MLRQYQLHGGIRRLRTRFDQSKRFETTTTMAASAAPTPWNRPPPSVDDFRWWDEIFLKLSRPLTSKDAIVHRMKYSGEPHHGKMHTILVPALEEFFSCLDEPRLKKIPGSETLETASLSCPQTTHFHQVRRIRQNCLKNNPIRRNNPIPPSKGDYCLPNQGADLQGQKPLDQRRLSCRDCGHPPPLLHPLPTNRHLTFNTMPGMTRSGQEILGTSDPGDIYGCYSEIFCSSTMTGDDKDATKVDTALPRSRSRSRSASKSRFKSGPSILEFLNCKKDMDKNKPVVKEIETFASIASRPPSPKATRHTVAEAAIAVATDKLAAAISKHSADFQALVTSSIVKRTTALENRIRADNVALMVSATSRVQKAGGTCIALERLYEMARQEEKAVLQLPGRAPTVTNADISGSKTTMSVVTDAEGFSTVNCRNRSPLLTGNPAQHQAVRFESTSSRKNF